MDGNFTADHMKMRHAEEDVPLTSGYGYMVEEVRYKEHLEKTGVDRGTLISDITLPLKMTAHLVQRSTCNNHRAVNVANMHRNNLESTGIGACACARHGCFVPHSVVDFQKGERYVWLNVASFPMPMTWEDR